MTSYRDPHLVETEEVFNETANFLKTLKLSSDDITKSIIGTFAKIDPPMFPDERAFNSMIRDLTGETEKMMEILKEEVVNTEFEDFKKSADILAKWSKSSTTKVLGSSSAIEKAIKTSWKNRKVKTVVIN